MKKRYTLFLLATCSLMKVAAQNPAYTKTTIVTGMNSSVAFTITPDGRYLVSLKNGIINCYSSTGTLLGQFYNMSDSTYNNQHSGLLGIEVDPDFTSNGFVYVYMVYRCCLPAQTGPRHLQVIRLTDVANTGTNPVTIFSHTVPTNFNGSNVGGNIRFRPSEPDKLYIGIGEIGVSSNAQLLTNPYGKFLRINKDGTIPSDNPFFDDGNPLTGNDDRIWTYGHRNPFDFCSSSVNDSLYYTENGTSANQNGNDEMGMLMKGRNYGWPTCEAFNNNGTTTPCSNPNMTDPIAAFAPVSGSMPVITGIIHYSSSVFPTLTNHVLVADNDRGRISDVTLANAPVFNTLVTNSVWDDFTTSSLTTLKEGADGCIYAMEGGFVQNAKIYRICPQGMYIDENTPQDFLLQTIQPNPASDQISVSFMIRSGVNVKITLHDIAGKEIKLIADNSYAPGNHNLKLNLNDFNIRSGIYFVTMQIIADEKPYFSQTKKFVVR